jgi:hypothetical protein
MAVDHDLLNFLHNTGKTFTANLRQGLYSTLGEPLI